MQASSQGVKTGRPKNRKREKPWERGWMWQPIFVDGHQKHGT
jgi:hypothetical protein